MAASAARALKGMAVLEALCDALLRVGVVGALVRACGALSPAELREQAALATYHSLLTTHYALLTTHYSLLTTHYSLLTTHYSLLTTHYSLLPTTYYLPPTTN